MHNDYDYDYDDNDDDDGACRALCFLHNCNPVIIHRDLKPANLLLNEDAHLKAPSLPHSLPPSLTPSLPPSLPPSLTH